MDVARGASQPPATPRSLIGRAGVGWRYPGAERWPGRGLPRARKPRRAKTLDYPGNGTRLSLETNHRSPFLAKMADGSRARSSINEGKELFARWLTKSNLDDYQAAFEDQGLDDLEALAV